jgi:hypothetical protein
MVQTSLQLALSPTMLILCLRSPAKQIYYGFSFTRPTEPSSVGIVVLSVRVTSNFRSHSIVEIGDLEERKIGRSKMADLSVRSESHSFLAGSTNWSAVWSGLFTFVGIWSVFELLGLAVFPAASVGSKVGLGIWSVVLMAIAMFIAGRQTGSSIRLSGHFDGVRHGMIMFGLSLMAMVVLMMTGTILLTDFPLINASARSSDFVNVFTRSDWVPFAALFLGWLGAIIGASSSPRPETEPRSAVSEMRPAA